MSLKLAANLNFLFTEGNATLSQRIQLAHAQGFRAVEIPYPAEQQQQEAVVQAIKETGIQVSLMNCALGEHELAFGATCIPGAEDAFKTLLNRTVQLAKTIDCNKIHIMAGLNKTFQFEDCLKTYTSNLKTAANVLEKENIVGVIEPINPYSLPSYFLNSYETAQKVLTEVNSKNIKLMVDVFHLQLLRGNVTNSFKELAEYIGHVQIAQAPHRHEPSVPGELDWKYVFPLIQQSYDGFIGCEYKPKTNTIEGLKWISELGFQM